MMKTMNSLMIGLAAASTTAALAVGDERPEYMGVFKTSVYMVFEWQVEEVTPFPEYSAQDLFQIASGSSTYYTQLLAGDALSAFKSPNQFVDAQVAVRRQLVSGDILVTETTMDVYHIGDSGINDLADLLRFVTNKNNTGSEEFMVLDSSIGMNVKIKMLSFANAEDSEALAGGFETFYIDAVQASSGDEGYNESEKTLIVVTSVMAFALLALSAVLIWVAGGWLVLRRQVRVLLHREEELTRMTQTQGIQQKPTHDTDEDESSPGKDEATNCTNPSGILGVNPYYGQSSNPLDGLGIKMTPARPRRSDADLESEIETPMSQYSDDGRAPIGITSMRKILANREGNHVDAALGAYGMKRLEYDDK